MDYAKLSKEIRNKNIHKVNWVRKVYDRDNWTCRVCKSIHNLAAHHKVKLRRILESNNITTVSEALACPAIWDLDNGITLCMDCHSKVHTMSHNGRLVIE